MSLSFRHLDVEGEVVSRLFEVVKEGRNLSIYIQQDGQEIDFFRDRASSQWILLHIIKEMRLSCASNSNM